MNALRLALDEHEGPVVLVGHSSGGFVITEAGDHPNVKHLVYMDAIIPDAGEPITRFMGKVDPSFGATFRAKGDNVWFDAAALTIHLTGRGWPEADARAFTDAFRTQRVSATVARPTVAAWRTIPSTLIRATDSEMDADVQNLCATRATFVIDIPGDHFPNWRKPDVIAAILTRIAREVGS